MYVCILPKDPDIADSMTAKAIATEISEGPSQTYQYGNNEFLNFTKIQNLLHN